MFFTYFVRRTQHFLEVSAISNILHRPTWRETAHICYHSSKLIKYESSTFERRAPTRTPQTPILTPPPPPFNLIPYREQCIARCGKSLLDSPGVHRVQSTIIAKSRLLMAVETRGLSGSSMRGPYMRIFIVNSINEARARAEPAAH